MLNLNPKPMKPKTRVHAANKTSNLMHALERMCWSDCHKGMTYGWIDQNIHKKYHISNNTCRYLIEIGFLIKRDNLYFHTGITPNQKVVQELLLYKRKKEAATWKKPVNKHYTNLFEQSVTETFPISRQEKDFITALRNLLNSTQTSTQTP